MSPVTGISIMGSKNLENLISIDELIKRAKEMGIDFGGGDPKNRLRYYVKLGLLPNAKRKRFNNNAQPEGAYPEWVLERLWQIHEKIKEGKSIQEIKREFTEKTTPTSSPPITYSDRGGAKFNLNWQILRKLFPLILGFTASVMVFASLGKIPLNFPISSFIAGIGNFLKFAKNSPEALPSNTPFSIEDFLIINPPTLIKSSLEVKDKLLVKDLIITKEGVSATFNSSKLTQTREYILPDLSGTICLDTGNCFRARGEVTTRAGVLNRITKYIAENQISNSSILDLYELGISINIDANGNVGIGRISRGGKLEVAGNLNVDGRIFAQGDICTALRGGRCLSMISGGGGMPSAGITGTGKENFIPLWSGSGSLGSSILFQTGNLIDIAGNLKVLGLQIPTGAVHGYVLTSDAQGNASWQPAPSGTLPNGIFGQTLRHNGTSWVPDSFLYNTGSSIGIGTTSTTGTLTLVGNSYFAGPLNISTTTSPQLLLSYDSLNNLKFLISSGEAKISSPLKILIDTTNGEVKLSDNVNLFNANVATVQAATFISNDATVRKSGERVFRGSSVVFKYPIPTQTSNTNYVFLTPLISNTAEIFPPQISGTQRRYAFVINFADDIPVSASSTWIVDFTNNPDIEFSFSGQNLSDLKEGFPHLTTPFSFPNDSWRLGVKVPSGYHIRVFNILLLAYDLLP